MPEKTTAATEDDAKKPETEEYVDIDDIKNPQKEESVDIETTLDKIYGFVKKWKAVSAKDVARKLKEKKSNVLFYSRMLRKKNLIEVKYPVFGSPVLVLKQREAIPPVEKAGGELVETYYTEADNVSAKIEIRREKGEVVPIYTIKPPDIGIGTQAFLDHIIDELVREVQVSVQEIVDPKKMTELRQKFFALALEKILDYLKIDERSAKTLAGMLVQRMYGLGEMDIILSDKYLEEIAVNNSNVPVVIYHKRHGWLKTGKSMGSEEEIYNLSSEIGRKVQRDITSLNPIMDAHLITGDRVAATLFPISTMGNTITIRKFSRVPWTVTSLCSDKYKTTSKEVAAFLWQALEYELNIMVAGGTASGKTSMLNALCAMIPPTQRLISIEDTREIFLPSYLHWNWIPLTTRNPNPEGQGEVSMLDLMIASLRMRPDRIMVGEVRTKPQAETMFEAMHTGHSVYTTMHADTAEQVKRRLLEPPIQIPKNELEALHLILVQYRDRRKNLRRTLELAEILTSQGSDVELNYLYRWTPRSDRVVEDLNMHTGMTLNEIVDDLKEREAILGWLMKRGIMDIEKLGLIMKKYYEDREAIVKASMKNKKIDDILR